MDYPKTRQEAKNLNVKYYFTGMPCVSGHIALRETKGNCIECRKIQSKKDTERRKGKPKSEAAKAAAKRYYEKNKDKVKLKAASRDITSVRSYKKKHKLNNPEYYKALTNQRRKRFKDATPIWLTKEQKKDIRNLYLEALKKFEETGVPYEVDHIIPINGKDVSGLHVSWNLRVITREENLRKSNKVE
jgi:hypothetical protein